MAAEQIQRFLRDVRALFVWKQEYAGRRIKCGCGQESVVPQPPPMDQDGCMSCGDARRGSGCKADPTTPTKDGGRRRLARSRRQSGAIEYQLLPPGALPLVGSFQIRSRIYFAGPDHFRYRRRDRLSWLTIGYGVRDLRRSIDGFATNIVALTGIMLWRS